MRLEAIDHHRKTNRQTLAQAADLGKQIASQLGGKAVWEIGRQALQYELIDPHNYLADVRNILSPSDPEQKPAGVMVGINHITMKDPPLAIELISDHIAPLDRVVAVSALKYIDPDRFPGIIIAPIASAASAYTGLEIKGAVHDRPGEAEHYTQHPKAIDGLTPLDYNIRTGRFAAKEMRKGKVVLFAAEGHRSDNGELQKGKPVSNILKLGGKESVYLPIAVIPPIKGKITPFGAKTELRIGKPVTYQEMTDEMWVLNSQIKKFNAEQDENHQLPELTMDDMLMIEIAKVTPPDRYGYYRSYMRFVGMEDYPF